MNEFTIEIIKGRFSPAPSSQYHITYNFKFEVKLSVLDASSASLVERTEETITDSARVYFKVHPTIPIDKSARMFRKDTRDAINTILTCLPLSVSGRLRRELAAFSLKKAYQAVKENMEYGFRAVDLYIMVRIENQRFVLDPHTVENSFMVPAADSSIQLLLNEYEEEGVNVATESYCCICHEGLRAGEKLLSMPCEHVFHGDCIKKWLSTSHYCPICRFEMPMDGE
ncbi:hypothetical protein ACS0TY_017697 [Phlomoides rotata]